MQNLVLLAPTGLQKQQLANRGPPDQYFRTQICQRWREGTCRNGAACTFAHGEEALRAPRPRPPPLGPPPQQAQLQGDAGAGEEGRSVNDRLQWEVCRVVWFSIVVALGGFLFLCVFVLWAVWGQAARDSRVVGASMGGALVRSFALHRAGESKEQIVARVQALLPVLV